MTAAQDDVLPPGLAPEEVVRLLEQAIGHGRGVIRIEDVLQGIRSGQYQLWVGERSACVTELNTYPTGRRILVLFLAAGDAREFRQCLPGIEAWARAQGCDAAMFWGRAVRPSVWERLIPGYVTRWYGQVKELR